MLRIFSHKGTKDTKKQCSEVFSRRDANASLREKNRSIAFVSFVPLCEKIRSFVFV